MLHCKPKSPSSTRDMLHNARSNYKRNHLSTLSRLSDDDVEQIWWSVSRFIQRQMLQRKGVYISGLGTFTFCQRKLNLGNKHLLAQKPVFILSEKLCQYYGLQQIKAKAAGVSVVPLSFSSLSAEGVFERDVLDRCVRETLQLLFRTVSTQPAVLLSFPGLGVLTFRQSRVKMMFCPGFILALDSTGKRSSALTGSSELSRCRGSESLRDTARPVSSRMALARVSADKQPLTEASAARRTHEHQEDGRVTVMGVTDGRTDRSLPNTVRVGCRLRDVEVCRPAGGGVSLTAAHRSPAGVNVLCCDHRGAGQELCYVCMQRGQRNLQFQTDERTRAEREQLRLLTLHQHHRDLLYFQKEEMDRRMQRASRQQVEAFNLATAEAQRHRTEAASASSRTHGSYIFAARPCSAEQRPQQRLYMQELMEEAGRRRQMQAQEIHQQQRVDSLRLLQLSEESALERFQQLLEKHDKAEKHRRALEAQNERKGSDRPDVDIWPVFGLMHSDPTSLSEQRRRAENISEELLKTGERRRREEMEKRLDVQKREREIMQRDHREMLAERMRRSEQLRHLRAECEENWRLSGGLKQQRDREELCFRRFEGQTLTDQLEKYDDDRCSQCKRSTANCGKSNIFRDMNCVSGSRLML